MEDVNEKGKDQKSHDPTNCVCVCGGGAQTQEILQYLIIILKSRKEPCQQHRAQRNVKYQETKQTKFTYSITRFSSDSMNTVYPSQEISNSCEVKKLQKNQYIFM